MSHARCWASNSGFGTQPRICYIAQSELWAALKGSSEKARQQRSKNTRWWQPKYPAMQPCQRPFGHAHPSPSERIHFCLFIRRETHIITKEKRRVRRTKKTVVARKSISCYGFICVSEMRGAIGVGNGCRQIEVACKINRNAKEKMKTTSTKRGWRIIRFTKEGRRETVTLLWCHGFDGVMIERMGQRKTRGREEVGLSWKRLSSMRWQEWRKSKNLVLHDLTENEAC